MVYCRGQLEVNSAERSRARVSRKEAVRFLRRPSTVWLGRTALSAYNCKSRIYSLENALAFVWGLLRLNRLPSMRCLPWDHCRLENC